MPRIINELKFGGNEWSKIIRILIQFQSSPLWREKMKLTFENLLFETQRKLHGVRTEEQRIFRYFHNLPS